MAATLTGTTPGDQGLFNRVGALGGRLNDYNGYQAAIEAGPATALALWDGADTRIRNTAASLTGDALSQISQMSAYPASLGSVAEEILIATCDEDAPLDSRDVPTALRTIVQQMLTATTSKVAANTVSAVATQTNLIGNGIVVVSAKDGRGRPLENLLAERIRLVCTDADSDGSARIELRGEVAETDKLSHRWPAGSGVRKGLATIDASSSENLIRSGAFDADDFTIDTPTGWTIMVGAAGFDILPNITEQFAGDACLSIVGDGATLSQLRVPLTGLQSLTPYAANFWIKTDSTPAAGALRVDLHDGSSVINDEAGTPNSIPVDLVTIGTNYVAVNGVFRLPEPLPAAVYLRIRLSTALETGKIVYLDHLAGAEMEPADTNNPGGTPAVVVFNGSIDFSTDDGNPELTNVFEIVTSNNRVSGFQELFDRFYDSSALGIVLPIAGTTLIDDALIV